MTFQPGSRLAAYLRDSGGDEQDLSIDQQESEITRWCNDHGCSLTRTFIDAARPGSTTIGRDGFHAMIAHFRQPHCPERGILVWKFSRFARDLDDAQFYRADLRRRGFEIVSLHDNIPAGLDGRFFEAAIDWMNQRFLSDLSIDVKRGLRHLVETYGAIPGTPPRGFMRQPVQIGSRRDGSPHTAHRWVPDPSYTDRIRQAFELRAAGATIKQITAATRLYQSKNCYPTFFRNRLYIGELVYGDLVIPDYCDPIVDRATFDRVQQLLDRNRQCQHLTDDNPNHPRRTSSSFILSGLLYCLDCRAPLNGSVIKSGNGSTYTYYICSQRHRHGSCTARNIPQAAIENLVIAELRQHILTPDNLTRIQDAIRSQHNTAAATTASTRIDINQRLATIRHQIANTTNAIASIGHSPALAAKLQELEHAEHTILLELDQLDRLELPQPTLEPVQLAQLSQHLTAALGTADRDNLRDLLRGLIDKIYAARVHKTITGVIYYYTPQLKKNDPAGLATGFYGFEVCPHPATTHKHKFTK